MARLTIPLSGLSKQINRLLEGYCFQILATNRDPDAHNGKIIQTATHLTWILAEYLADTGCTGLVKLICKENKEQRGKQKFHEGVPNPNDRGGFTQWFGFNTLYV